MTPISLAYSHSWEHDLPDREQLADIARGIGTEEDELPAGPELDRLLDAACGLTRYEAEGAFSLSLHVSTLHRWRTRGIAGRRLSCIRVGGRWYSSLTRVEEFISLGTDGGQSAPRPGRRAATAQQQLADQYGL